MHYETDLFKGMDHLAIAVSNTEESLKTWRDKFGFKLLFSEKVNNESVLLTHLDMGNMHLQLVEPLASDHPLWEWLARNGGDGLHHFCLRTDEVCDAKEVLTQSGIQTAEDIHEGTQGKRAMFVQKESTNGVQVEITGR